MSNSIATHHLAQINVGRILYPIDAPEMAGFAGNLDAINAAAEQAPGFVWRLQSEAGNATDILTTPDPQFIINMSVWTGIDALKDYVYRSVHTPFIGKRKQWFEPHTQPFQTLWWIEPGHIPTPQEGLAKLEHLRAHGPSAAAFTFKQAFLPNGTAAKQIVSG